MALIQVSYELIDDDVIFDLLCDAFDTIEEVRDEPWNKVKVLRVNKPDEITTDDKVICPTIQTFPGIKPFIIEFDC